MRKKTRNASGEEVVAWVDDLGTWGEVKALQGMEYFNSRSQQIQTEVTHRIRIGYRELSNGDRIGPSCRVKFKETEAGARYFDIENVIDAGERKRGLEIMAIETESVEKDT